MVKLAKDEPEWLTRKTRIEGEAALARLANRTLNPSIPSIRR